MPVVQQVNLAVVYLSPILLPLASRVRTAGPSEKTGSGITWQPPARHRNIMQLIRSPGRQDVPAYSTDRALKTGGGGSKGAPYMNPSFAKSHDACALPGSSSLDIGVTVLLALLHNKAAERSMMLLARHEWKTKCEAQILQLRRMLLVAGSWRDCGTSRSCARHGAHQRRRPRPVEKTTKSSQEDDQE